MFHNNLDWYMMRMRKRMAWRRRGSDERILGRRSRPHNHKERASRVRQYCRRFLDRSPNRPSRGRGCCMADRTKMNRTGQVEEGKTKDEHRNELPYPEHAHTAYCYRGNDYWDDHGERPWMDHEWALPKRWVDGGRGAATLGCGLGFARRLSPWKRKVGLH
jgi:hypothetical protein